MKFTSNKHNTVLYNNLLILSRNIFFSKDLNLNDDFETRLYLMFIHFSIILKIYKRKNSKFNQTLYDSLFHNIEYNIREMGYGDVSINKNMKNYLNYFYDIISNINDWDKFDYNQKSLIIEKIINKSKNISFFVNYFDKLATFYKNNALNFFTKDIEEFKI